LARRGAAAAAVRKACMFRWWRVFSAPAQRAAAGVFSFLEPGVLVDRELRLVEPEPRWLDDLLLSATHPLTRQEALEPSITRQSLLDFLRAAPRGRESPAPDQGRAPTYHFWMRLDGGAPAALPMAGAITLRIGRGRDIEMYFGHVGYNVFPPMRGHHYAERACRLLFPLARQHGLRPLWITADPENVPSRRTCQRLGGSLVEIVDVPPAHVLHARGELRKCRYRIDI
jgi:predicted acetyltransferase